MDNISISTPTELPTIYSAYGPKLKISVTFPPGTGRTKQSFANEVDINNIMAKYIKTGTLEFTRRHEPRYGDVIGADFQTAMNIVTQANSMFADLPAQLRARFDNDPAKFMDFVNDLGTNRAEAEELGLITRQASSGVPASPTPVPAPAAPSAPQNRTPDGQYTFDKPPSGPGGDAPGPGARRRGAAD